MKKCWKPDFMSIQEDLLLIMKRSNDAKSTAEIDKCIREYKEILGEIEDETDGLKCIIQLRESKAQEQISKHGLNLSSDKTMERLN